MVPKDWIKLVAEDIRKQFPLTEDSLREIINRHCLFKEGVAYEPIKQSLEDRLNNERTSALDFAVALMEKYLEETHPQYRSIVQGYIYTLNLLKEKHDPHPSNT